MMSTDSNSADMALLEALRGGEEKAFDCLFKKYYAVLCAYVHRFVDWEDAENIVQEIMLRMWEKRGELMVERSLSQYLFKTAYHYTLNMIARKEVVKRSEAMFHSEYQELPDNMDYNSVIELTKRIEEAINNLPESYRPAFVMHRFKGMSYKQIAELLEVSPKTVDYRIGQALKLLREQLKDYLPVSVLLTIKLLQQFR